MYQAAAAWTLLAVRAFAVQTVPNGATGHAARDFRVAAGRLREIVEEMKAAAWDEEHEGRSPDVDAAVADFARASLEASRQAEEVVNAVRLQPPHAAVELRSVVKQQAAEEQQKSLDAKSLDQWRFDTLDLLRHGHTATAQARAVAAVRQNSHKKLEHATEAAVDALGQHLRARAVRHVNEAATAGADQDLRKRKLTQATDAAEEAIKGHMRQKTVQTDKAARVEKLRHATAAAEEAIKGHMRQRRKAIDAADEADAVDGEHMTDEAIQRHAEELIRKHKLKQATAAAEEAIRGHMELRRQGHAPEEVASAAAQSIPSAPVLQRQDPRGKVSVDKGLQDVIDATVSGKMCGMGGPCIDGNTILATSGTISAGKEDGEDGSGEDADESPLSQPLLTPL